MLKIRPEQYDVFKPVAEEVFVGEVVEYLRREYGERIVQLPNGPSRIDSIPEHNLRSMVKGGIADARNYGLNGRGELTGFVVLMFLTAPNFDQHPLIQHVLTDASVQPEARLNELWQRTVDGNWVAVRQSYDSSAWSLMPESPRDEHKFKS